MYYRPIEYRYECKGGSNLFIVFRTVLLIIILLLFGIVIHLLLSFVLDPLGMILTVSCPVSSSVAVDWFCGLVRTAVVGPVRDSFLAVVAEN